MLTLASAKTLVLRQKKAENFELPSHSNGFLFFVRPQRACNNNGKCVRIELWVSIHCVGI